MLKCHDTIYVKFARVHVTSCQHRRGGPLATPEALIAHDSKAQCSAQRRGPGQRTASVQGLLLSSYDLRHIT